MAAGVVPAALGMAAARGGGGATPTPRPAAAAAATSIAPPTAAKFIDVTDGIPRLNLENPEESIPETWAKPAPFKSSFGQCGPYGSEHPDSGTNVRKNRTDLPREYHTVTFEALANLGWPHEAKPRRDGWTKEQLAEIAPYEGVAVTVTGFIVALRPQAKSGESPNCGETGEANTDWHIALVGESDDKEPKAIVVETTPRIKQFHPNWTPNILKPYVGSGDSVRVSGWVLFDPVHKGHLGKYRQSLWEVHPIHRIEVFTKGKWKDIDAP